MDNLDRMFRHLVRTVRSRFPQYLTQPFDVAELNQNVLPYRHHRRELGLDTNEDYEITLTELLSGARDYLIVDDRMRDVLRAELASTNPDPSAFKQFASATVSIAPSALRALEIGPEEDGPSRASMPAMNVTAERSTRPSAPERFGSTSSRPAPTPAQVAASIAPSATPSSQPTITPRSIVPQVGQRCGSCSEVLPPGRAITFCPHCGQNVTTMHCPACGSELEVGWKFCPTCGRPAAAG
jgi:hypothetical protein